MIYDDGFYKYFFYERKLNYFKLLTELILLWVIEVFIVSFQYLLPGIKKMKIKLIKCFIIYI